MCFFERQIKCKMRVKSHLFVTYIVPPANLIDPGIRLDVALEEDIDSFAQRGVQGVGAKFKAHNRNIWMRNTNKKY